MRKMSKMMKKVVERKFKSKLRIMEKQSNRLRI